MKLLVLIDFLNSKSKYSILFKFYFSLLLILFSSLNELRELNESRDNFETFVRKVTTIIWSSLSYWASKKSKSNELKIISLQEIFFVIVEFLIKIDELLTKTNEFLIKTNWISREKNWWIFDKSCIFWNRNKISNNYLKCFNKFLKTSFVYYLLVKLNTNFVEINK